MLVLGSNWKPASDDWGTKLGSSSTCNIQACGELQTADWNETSLTSSTIQKKLNTSLTLTVSDWQL